MAFPCEPMFDGPTLDSRLGDALEVYAPDCDLWYGADQPIDIARYEFVSTRAERYVETSPDVTPYEACIAKVLAAADLGDCPDDALGTFEVDIIVPYASLRETRWPIDVVRRWSDLLGRERPPQGRRWTGEIRHTYRLPQHPEPPDAWVALAKVRGVSGDARRGRLAIHAAKQVYPDFGLHPEPEPLLRLSAEAIGARAAQLDLAVVAALSSTCEIIAGGNNKNVVTCIRDVERLTDRESPGIWRALRWSFVNGWGLDDPDDTLHAVLREIERHSVDPTDAPLAAAIEARVGQPTHAPAAKDRLLGYALDVACPERQRAAAALLTHPLPVFLLPGEVWSIGPSPAWTGLFR